MRVKEFIAKMAMMAGCGAILLLGGPQKAADANYFHLIECELKPGDKLEVDTSQKEVAKRAIFFREVGSFNDGGDAILGAFCHYYQPKFLTELYTIDEDDAKKITKWLNDLGPNGLKEHAKQRVAYGGANMTYFGPYNSAMGGDKPYCYLVTLDKPVWYIDKDGLKRIDADKTNFFGSYRAWAPFAYLSATTYEAEGKMLPALGSTSSVQGETVPGFALYGLMLSSNNFVYNLRKENGDSVIPQSVFRLANRYWELRKSTDATVNRESMEKKGEWNGRVIGNIHGGLEDLYQYMFDHPVSKAPAPLTEPRKFAATKTPSRIGQAVLTASKGPTKAG